MHAVRQRIGEFAAHVDTVFTRDEPDSFYECESALTKLVGLDSTARTEFVQAVLGVLLDQIDSLGNLGISQFILHRGQGYAISISLLEHCTRYIHTSPFLGMYIPLGGVALEYERFYLPASYRNEIYDSSVRLEGAGDGQTPNGEILRIHPSKEVYDFKISKPQLVLKFTSSAWHVLEWLFDRKTLLAVQANDAALSTTQLRVAAYLLGRLGNASSIEPLKKLAEHHIPNIRWAAIQQLGRLSAGTAIERLERAVDDPHPHIRRAAQQSLLKLRN